MQEMEKKGKAYRIVGMLFAILGIIKAYQSFMTRYVESFDMGTILVGILHETTLNLFLWVGVYFLWKAQRTEKPGEKHSISNMLLIVYAVLTVIMGALAAVHI